MIGSILRVLFGFVLACLAAGATLVLFVYTPVELASDAGERVQEAGLLTLAAATHAAVFAAPFALIGAAIGEWRAISSWTYYALVGVVIAVIGFLVQYWSEGGREPVSILNSYALSAFLVTGLVAGLVYWLASGRYAGPSDGGAPVSEPSPTPRTIPPGGVSPARPAADET
jgi:MFS family permease